MQNTDPKAFYKCLGISPTATADEIKAAFRRLAKETHPDTSGASSGAQFQELKAAYEVLIDPEARATYDSSGYDASPEDMQREQLNPICCSRCGQTTAQPRYIVFRRVYSFQLATVRSPVQGIFCSACARREAFKSSLITMVAGWWGFPWGPIYTVGAILKNGFGGEHPRDAEERLVWYNCIAFLSRGDLDIAYALARSSRDARDREISSKATKLMGELETHAVVSKRLRLRNPWRINPFDSLKHVAMAAVMPAVLLGLIMQDQVDSWWTGKPLPKPSYAGGRPYAPPPVQTVQPVETPTQNLVPAFPCHFQPESGDLLQGFGFRGDNGHVLEIKNGSGGNAIVKMRDAITNRMLASFFIANDAVAALRGIPDGRYRFQYAFGGELGEDCRSFIHTTAAGQFPEAESLETERTATQIITRHLTYTLYTVPSGNVRPRSLSVDAFNAP